MGEAVADTNQEKRIMHYSSNQKILLVGEGNFSFAFCLAKEFGSATNMVATSLDSRESVLAKYANAAPKNLTELEDMGCVMLHEVDVHTMRQHHLLMDQLFDRIVFNFPHAGFIFMESQKSQIKLHQELVRRFFTSACEMLTKNGEVHVTHKTTYPFNKWKIVKLAEEAGLYLVKESPFFISDYPGYCNMRGSGGDCNQTFRVGQCSTYKFAKLPLHEFSFTRIDAVKGDDIIGVQQVIPSEVRKLNKEAVTTSGAGLAPSSNIPEVELASKTRTEAKAKSKTVSLSFSSLVCFLFRSLCLLWFLSLLFTFVVV